MGPWTTVDLTSSVTSIDGIAISNKHISCRAAGRGALILSPPLLEPSDSFVPVESPGGALHQTRGIWHSNRAIWLTFLSASVRPAQREDHQIGHLWVMAADGSRQKQLTDGPMDESDASYSRDGRSIAFCRTKGGISHVWVMDSDGRNQKQLTFGPWYHGLPRFAPDAARLVFSRTEEERPHFQPAPGPSSLRMPESTSHGTDQYSLGCSPG
jgi:dipeptidyl aminopeptidase/acylaminoacyl peptidase